MTNSTKRVGDRDDAGRLEAFSDGVFAIAITLLILDIKVPRELPPGVTLGEALAVQWPAYVAFLNSFVFIGIMWLNHHRLFTMIRKTDHWLLVINGALLLGVCIVPFPTSLLAEYIGKPGERTAAMVYSSTFLVASVAFNILWRYASAGRRLIDSSVTHEDIVAQTRQYAGGPLLFLAATVIAWFSVPACVIFTLGLAGFFAIPPRRRHVEE